MAEGKQEDRRHIGAKAHRTAVQRLIEKHEDEFTDILGDAREELGLPRESAPPKKLSKLEQLREQLKAAGIDPTV